MYSRAVEQYAYHYKMRYPGQEYQTSRELRLSPLYKILKDKGSVYGSKNGWERPLWFAPKGVEPIDQLDFLNPGWHKYVAEEHRSVREKVALIDQTSFGKFELFGNGSLELLQYLTTCNMDKPIGSVIYSQLCNEKGGIEADLTITRLNKEHFYIVTGSTFGIHDADWIRQHIPKEKSIYLIDVSSSRAVINICGPKSREVLQKVSENDLSNISFPFGTAKEIIIGSAKVLAIRIGYVGELGWELHIPTEFTHHVYKLLSKTGEKYGIRDIGYRAIESLRMEKGYLYWSSDITPDYTPLEAGLDFRVHLKSKGDFIGKEALIKQKINGIKSKLCTFISEKKLSLFGGETILLNGKTVSLATSAGYGFTVNKAIIFGYLDTDILDSFDFEIEVFGEQYPIKKVDGPMYDSQNKQLKI